MVRKAIELPKSVVVAFEALKGVFHQNIPDSTETLDLIRKIESYNDIYAPLASHEYEAFNSAYFLRNGLKNLIALEYSRNALNAYEVIDIGCGAGTSSIAWRLLSNRKGVRFNLVDKSQHQIRLAKTLLQTSLFANDFANLETHLTLPKCKTALSILSYSVCEMKMSGMTAAQILSTCSKHILVVDYKEVLTWFINKNRDQFNRFQISSESYVLPESIRTDLRQSTIKVSFLNAEW